MAANGLRFLPRVEFKARHFPQTLCAGCPHLRTCGDLLGQATPMEFWLVRDGGVCARAFPATNPPPDIKKLRALLLSQLREHARGPA